MADPAVVAQLILEHAEAMVIGSPSLPIAYPDVTFVPPADGKYLRLDLFTNEPFWQGLSSGRIDQGLLQVMVVWPRAEGRIRPLEVAAMVMEHWAKLTTLQGSGTRVRVNKEPWAATPLLSPSETETPITIPWNAV
jgi:hypothetical protein